MKFNMHRHLHSWDIASQAFRNNEELDLKSDLAEFESLLEAFTLKFDPSILISKDFDALVVTDDHLSIQWVSAGFTKMTGYSRDYALQRTPKFLQGPKTVPLKRSDIEAVKETGKVLTATVKNYRADDSIYTCRLEILPLFDHSNLVSHYLAIEKEL